MDTLSPLPAKDFNAEAAAHLMWRAGFGCDWQEAREVSELGLDSAVDRLVFFEPSKNIPMPACAELLESPKAFEIRLRSLPDDDSRQAARRERNQTERQNINQLKVWWLNRMLKSSLISPGVPPLEEKLTLFWHSHFASGFEDKIEATHPLWRQNMMFRQFAISPFPEQLETLLHDPAMLLWLDNASSAKGRPNENLARELMELFSLGVGNYSEADVKASARALTGLSVNRETWDFEFRAQAHDSGEKTFLGETGNWSEADIVRIICGQPCTADFLSRKFLDFFVCTNPDPSLVEVVATRYRETGYNLRELLRTVFRSEMFYSPASRNAVVKSPVVLALGALKSMQAPLPPGDLVLNALRVMGQDLFFPPDVNGWPGGADWINSNTLLVRYNFSNFLMNGVSPDEFKAFDRKTIDRGPARRTFVDGERNPDAVDWDPKASMERQANLRELQTSRDIVDYYIREFLQRPPSREMRDAIVQLAETDAAGGRRPLTIRDENFNERARGLVHLIMSSPDYQLC